MPHALEVVEERADELGVELAEVERAGRGAGAVAGEAEQQPPGVPVGQDGVRADPALGEPVGEEALQHRRERGHGRPAFDASMRSATTPISCGTAWQYQ